MTRSRGPAPQSANTFGPNNVIYLPLRDAIGFARFGIKPTVHSRKRRQAVHWRHIGKPWRCGVIAKCGANMAYQLTIMEGVYQMDNLTAFDSALANATHVLKHRPILPNNFETSPFHAIHLRP